MRSVCEFAGLGDVGRTGLSVKEVGERLRRFAYIERRLMFIQARFVVTVEERNFKVWLARLQYQAGRRADLFRKRLPELRLPKTKIDSVPSGGLSTWLDYLSNAPDSASKWLALRSVYRQLLSAYESYLSVTNPLADAPTVEALEPMVQQLTRICEMFDTENGLSHWPAESLQNGQRFAAALDHRLGATGDVNNAANATIALSDAPAKIPHKTFRDSSFPRVWDYVAPPQTDVAQYLAYMMGLRLSEINVAEGLAIVLNETAEKPWEFYYDLSRHLWDEVRHSLMGEAAIVETLGDRGQIPIRDYEGVYCMEASPLEQYATLGLEIEGANMKYPIGKRGEWEFCRDAAKHRLMTLFQDYDWADEVVHVNIAKAQLSHWFEGGAAGLSEFAAQGKLNRSKVKHRHPAVPMPALEQLEPSTKD
jgi:hypothetical protein